MARPVDPVHLRPDGSIATGERRTLPSELLELLRQPAWMADALCKEYDGARWFPERGEDVQRVKAICAECLVQGECLEWALAQDQTTLVGIWAGTSGRDRRRIAGAKRAAAA